MEDKNRFSFVSTQGFAERLRRRRLGLGLRKQDLAAQVGVSLTTIQQYENGQLPKGEFAVRLGAALRCSLDWLLAGQGNVEGALQDQWAGLVMVPMVEARLSAGTGSFETSGDVVRHYAFREDFCGARAARRTWPCCGSPATAWSPASATMTWSLWTRARKTRCPAASMP